MTYKHKKAKRGVIAVCGSTGRQGGAIARKLLQEGWDVRALTRNPDGSAARSLVQAGATVLCADLGDPKLLDIALQGSDGVFGVTDFWEHGFEEELRMGINLIESAKRAMVRHFVFSSVGATERTSGMGITHFEAKAEIESHLRQSGLDWTILRPVTFMENIITPRFRRAICERGILRFGFNRKQVIQMVAMDDMAAFAALAFEGDSRIIRQATEIASDAFTMDEWAATLEKHLERNVRYAQVTPVQLHLAGLFISLTRRHGHYKAGPSLINQFRWHNESLDGGWAADIDRLRSIHPDLSTLKQWATTIDWGEGL